MVEQKAAHALKAQIFTIAISMALIVIKAVAFAFSGSLAVLSSLIDSALDVSVSGMNYAAVSYSSKPADEDHRYGHGKIEGLAALLQAMLIAGGAVLLLWQAISRLITPVEIESHILIIAVMTVSAVFSQLIVAIQNHAIKKSGSLAIEADNANYTADIFMNGGVILTVVVQYFSGPMWIDTVFGLAVACWLCILARRVGGKGLDMVLDRELPQSERQKLLDLIASHKEVLGVHDLRTTRSGMKEIIAFDIEVDPSLLLYNAHAITKDLEREILEIFPHAEIMIHVDPHGDIDDSRHTVGGVHH